MVSTGNLGIIFLNRRSNTVSRKRLLWIVFQFNKNGEKYPQ